MIKKLTGVLSAVIIGTTITSTTVHADTISVKINNNVRSYDQVPLMKDNRVYIPIRGISEDTGAIVGYSNKEKKVTITKDAKVIEFTIGSAQATVNNEIKEIPESFISNGRTMLPLRFINEMLGYRVDWFNEDKMVVITTDRGLIETGITTAAAKYIGIPYLYGGSYEKDGKFDCSSFIQKVFAESGIQLPRTSSQQSLIGEIIPLEEARTGDLVFFDTAGNGTVSHVAIFINQDTLLHATTSKGVDYTSFSKYWQDRVLMAKDILLIK